MPQSIVRAAIIASLPPSVRSNHPPVPPAWIRRVAGLALSLLLMVTVPGNTIAAEFIGVAAALRGDVIRVASVTDEGEIGPLF